MSDITFDLMTAIRIPEIEGLLFLKNTSSVLSQSIASSLSLIYDYIVLAIIT